MAALSVALLIGSRLPHASAASGAFSNVSGGLWSVPTNWTGGIVADGAGNLANFSSVTAAAGTVISLDTSRTIGQLSFGSSWTIDNNGVSANVLSLNNSGSSPVVTATTNGQITNISAVLAGTSGFTKTGAGAIALSGSNTYSGTTIINSTTSTQGADIYLFNNAALGTSRVYIDPGSANNARMLVNPGLTINNNFQLHTSRAQPGANGTLMMNVSSTAMGSATFTGSITIDNKSGSGGHFAGPTDDTLTNFLKFTGPIYLSNLTTTLADGVTTGTGYNASSSLLTNTQGNGVQCRAGNVSLGGGGSYFRLEMRSGDLQVGADNGIATNAYLDLGGNANGNPSNYAYFDINGHSQTMIGVEDSAGLNGTFITNNSNTSSATLTLTPVAPGSVADTTYHQANLSFAAQNLFSGNAGITDSFNSATGTATPTSPGVLNIVINGASNGVQTFNFGFSGTYDGSTTLTNGILAVTSLANGGSASSIGRSTSDATNLIFGSGTLRYTGATTSTDRNFTLNAGVVGTIDVSNAATTLTMSGGGTGSGGLNKAGAGILLLSGTHTYAGTTSVTAGTLLVNGSIASTAAVSVLNAATLGGTGTVAGGVTPAAGGAIAPGSLGIGTLSVGGLTLNTGSILNFEFGTGNDQINVTNTNGLTINGASLNLYQPNTTTTFATDGTYTLFNITGTVAGSISNISISNPAAGKIYGLATAGSAINLTIADATTREWNDGAANQQWNTAANWIGGVVPNGIGQTALFGSNLVGSNGTVTLASAETVGGLLFNNSSVSYALGGSGSLILNNGVAATAVDVQSGTHSINVPILLNGATAFNTTNPTDALTVTGDVTGAKAITTNGPGVVILTGTNSFTTVGLNGGTFNVGNGGATGTLGSGTVTLSNNATLNFNTSASYVFGQGISGQGGVNQIGAGTTTVGAMSGLTTVNVSNGALVATAIGQSAGINVTGTGSLTASGAVTGGGKLTVNTTGSVSLAAANSYGGGTEIDGGTVTLNASGALPTVSVLAVNGGVLDLKGTNISVSNFLDTTVGGVINNSAANTTSTITFAGSQLNYNVSAALNDGTSGGKVALITSIFNGNSSSNGIGSEYTLTLHSPGNYSGGTTVVSQSIEAAANNALGTGPITLNLNNASTNNSRIYVDGGVTLPNNITIAQPNSFAGFGAIQYAAGASGGSATLTGTITVQADTFTGGMFVGPTNPGDTLNVSGPVFTAGTATSIITNGGNVAFGGGGSYANLVLFSNVSVSLLANNGVATNALVHFNSGTFDLASYNQTITGMVVNASSGLITNSNTSSIVPTLTVNTAVNDFYNGNITGPLSLAKAGIGLLNFQTAPAYTGNTQVSAGTLTFSAAAAGRGIRIIGLPGAFNIGAGALATVAPSIASGDRTLLSVGSLTVAGTPGAYTGKFDLFNNDLDIMAGSLTTVTSLIQQGFNAAAGGYFNGAAGIISTTAATDTTHLTAVGAIQNSLNQSPSGTTFLATFDGQTVTSTDVLVKYTYFGDANLDGVVDGSDYSRIDSGFLAHATGWFNGDFNYDGVVNGSDYTLIDNAFNTQGASLAALIAALTTQIAVSTETSAVPEPTTLGILGIGIFGMLGRRRRNF